MKNLKNIISGVLSVTVLFMTVQVGVAQESVVASGSDVELSTPGFFKIVQKMDKDVTIDNASINTAMEKTVNRNTKMENHGVVNFVAPTNWYYKGPTDDPSEFNNPDNWQPEPIAGVECDGTEDIPCSTNELMDYPGLQSLLSSHTGSLLFTKVSRRDQ